MAQIVRVTASEEIYQTLREEILSLRFKPGEELNLQQLSVQLQVSRSPPVRDALMRLSSDNLVDIYPQKGTRVSLINLKQVEEERFFCVKVSKTMPSRNSSTKRVRIISRLWKLPLKNKQRMQ